MGSSVRAKSFLKLFGKGLRDAREKGCLAPGWRQGYGRRSFLVRGRLAGWFNRSGGGRDLIDGILGTPFSGMLRGRFARIPDVPDSERFAAHLNSVLMLSQECKIAAG
jgi:hypothetical protein